VAAIAKVFPRALVQWEDFANANAFAVLNRYRRRVLSFDDDIQGTGAVVVAGILSALRMVERPLADERVVFFGAGAAGAGSALAVRMALREAGVSKVELSRRVLCLDSKGLILADRRGLAGAKQDVAADPQLAADWSSDSEGAFRLDEVVRRFKPTVLVGTSGQPGAFSESIIRDMLAGCSRPVILPISNPNSKTEATPAELIQWTNGAAVIGTGSPFAPVQYEGRTFTIGQGNNALIFPGVGLGATAVDARGLPDEAFMAAARALFTCTTPSAINGHAIYPPLSRLREVSQAVAIAVGRSLVDAGVAPALAPDEIQRRVREAMWEPDYLPYRAATPEEAASGLPGGAAQPRARARHSSADPRQPVS
jgi:malate dehydrogenase (oxaloacetate-decarboxylating)